MGCLDENMFEVFLGTIWGAFSILWLLKILLISKRYTTMMHCFITPMLLLNTIIIIDLPLCYLSELASFFEIISDILSATLFIIRFIMILGGFYFISIGFGLCYMRDRRFDELFLAIIMIPSYPISALLYFLPMIGSLLSPFFYIYQAFIFIRLIRRTQNYLENFDSGIVRLKLNLLRNFKEALLLYFFFISTAKLVYFFIGFYNGDLFWVRVFEEGARFGLILRVFWVVRPKKEAGFSNDLMFPVYLTEGDMIQASVQNGSDVMNPKGAIAVTPGENYEILFAKPYKEYFEFP
jgi:hypothetical protein